MKELVEVIARALVEYPDAVSVTEVEGKNATVLELRVHADDVGKVIGRQGRNAKAIRTVIKSVAMKEGKRVMLEIIQ